MSETCGKSNFLVEHELFQHYAYWLYLPGGWITQSDEYLQTLDLQI